MGVPSGWPDPEPVLTERQREAQTLVSILNDYLAGKPMSEPKWRKAMYCASAVFGHGHTTAGDEW